MINSKRKSKVRITIGAGEGGSFILYNYMEFYSFYIFFVWDNIFFYYLSILFKKKDYRNPTTFGRSPRIFDLSYSRPKKGEERSIKVLTSSPKTIKLNLQLIEEEVIIPFLLLEKGLTWSRSTLQNHCWEFDSLIPCHYWK